jgi:hypothetical protein
MLTTCFLFFGFRPSPARATKSKTVLMSLTLIVAFTTVYLSFYLEAEQSSTMRKPQS